MNFGPGTNNQPRTSILRRDPELRPAITSSITVRPSRLHTVTIRPAILQRKSIRITRNSAALPYQNKIPDSLNKLECPICLSGILPASTMKPTAVRCCGYVFCGTCINRCIRNFHKCPMCNQKWVPNGIVALRFHSR